MAKKFKYEMLGGPFDYWAVASAFADGYKKACKANGVDPGHVGYFLYRDIYSQGYVPKGMGEGFYALRRITLTDEQRKEIDRKAAEKKAAAAEQRAKEATAEAAKYRKMAAA